MRQIKSPLLSALLLGVVFGLSSCGQAHDGGQASAPMFTDDHGLLTVPSGSPLRSRLSVEPVQAASSADALAIPAAVEAEPSRLVNILTPLTGRVRSVDVRLGQRVRRGQLLMTIESGDLAGADADLAKAQDSESLAAKTLARARGVQAAGGASTKDIEAAQSSYVQAQAETVRARERLHALNGVADSDAALVKLTAPENGVVTALSIAAGAMADDPTAVLMTVANIDRVFIAAEPSEDQIGRVRQGAAADVTFSAYPGYTLHGRISEVDTLVAADTRRLKARIEAPNPDGRLMPNMYATVSVAQPPAGGVWAPQSALLMNNDAVTVLVEVRPWAFQRRAVTVGDETATQAHVISGLNPGDRVVVRGGVLLGD